MADMMSDNKSTTFMDPHRTTAAPSMGGGHSSPEAAGPAPFGLDPEIHGPSGHSGDYPTAEGRFDGGGWIDGPYAYSAEHGKGIWAQPPAETTGENHGPGPSPGNPNLLDLVKGWHERFLAPRQEGNPY